MNAKRTSTDSVDLKQLDQILAPLGQASAGDLIPVLQQIQQAYGYLPQEVLLEFSKRSAISASQIFGVATFYTQFSFTPRGKHTIRVCRGTACHVRGGKKVQTAIQQQLGLGEGESSPDMQFTFETVGCLGACALSPLITVGPAYYGKMTAKRAKMVVAEYAKE